MNNDEKSLELVIIQLNELTQHCLKQEKLLLKMLNLCKDEIVKQEQELHKLTMQVQKLSLREIIK